MTKILNVFNKINFLRERYYEASIGKDALVKLISETEVVEQVFNSNAIENSTLTFEETEKILLQIDLDRFINEREIFEAKNLARVVSYIDTREKSKLTPDIMLLLHKMLILIFATMLLEDLEKTTNMSELGIILLQHQKK